MADLVVRNGNIVDGTGAPAFVGDVHIVDGRIAAVARADGGQPLDAPAGTHEIDATGLLVTPGGSTSTRTTTARPPGIPR